MDDFGDLYGDLDGHMSDKNEESKIEPKPIQDDSLVEESESNGKVATSEAKGLTNLEEENGDNSNSDDDDFRIVLNEDECPKFQPSKGGITGIDEEDECDDIADHLNNDQRWNDELPAMAANESMQGSEVRGIVMNGSHRPSRHVRSHFAGLPSSVRPSVSGRGGAWDKPLMPCLQGAASYSRDIFSAAQTGVTFCLPRNRTIFDINIEAFEQKPWRYHGADITDYFNFGLDEKSWKSYCESLDHFRKQAMMSNRFPVYQSSRLNQGGIHSSLTESLEKGGMGSDMPKGRAIQVEGGLGERIPSTDIRRPRVLDSDVVIQINMEGSAQDASALCKNSLEHAEEHIDASASTSGNDSNERVLSPNRDGRICRDIANSFEHYSHELKGSEFKGTHAKIKSNVDGKKDDHDLFRKDACMVELGSDSGDQVPHCSSSCNLQSHSEESKDVFCMGKDTRPIKKTSVKELKDSIESDYYLSYDSISDATEYEQEDSKDDVHERDLSSGEYNVFSQTRLKSVAELNVAKDDEQTSILVHRKHQNELDLGDIRCKTRKRKSNYDTDDGRRHLYSYRESEVSLSYKSRRNTANYGSDKYFTNYSRKDDSVTHPNRNWDEEDCLEQSGCYFSERRHEDRGRRSSRHKYSDQPMSKNKSFNKEKDSCLHLAKEREHEHWIRMEPKCDDIIRDQRYREHYVQDMHGRHVDFYDVEEENFAQKFHRHVYPTDRKMRSSKRSRHDRRLSFEKNRSSKYIENDAFHRLVSQIYEEPSNTDERDWHDTCSPREHLCNSWRSNGRYVNHRGHSSIRDLQFKNKTNGHVVPNIKDHHYLSYEDNVESDIEGYISEGNTYHENIVSSIQMRRYNRLSKQNLHADDGARFRHCEQGGLLARERFLLERSLKHDNFQVRKPFFCRRRLLGGRLLDHARKVKVVGTSDSDVRDHVNFVPDLAAGHELEAVGCREAVNKHLNGFKGKLARRCSGVAEESEEIGTGYKANQLKNSRKLKAYRQEEIYPHTSKDGGRHNHQTGLKVGKLKDSESVNSGLLDKLPISQNVEDNEIEEGELIEESTKNDVVLVTKDWNSGKKMNFQSKDSSHNGKNAGTYDNSRILETLAKMEKRKERFKEPIAPKKEPEKNMDPLVDVSVVSDEIKQQRPARKRRWGGN